MVILSNFKSNSYYKKIKKRYNLKLIKVINGKSLLERTLESAGKLVRMEDVCLSSDSKEYYNHLKNVEKPIFLERSKNLSGDKSLAIEVWKNAIEFLNKENNKYNFSLFLEPT